MLAPAAHAVADLIADAARARCHLADLAAGPGEAAVAAVAIRGRATAIALGAAAGQGAGGLFAA